MLFIDVITIDDSTLKNTRAQAKLLFGRKNWTKKLKYNLVQLIESFIF